MFFSFNFIPSNEDFPLELNLTQRPQDLIHIFRDLIDKRISLNSLNGIAFAGGFSFADVLGSAKGWYKVIKNNDYIYKQFEVEHCQYNFEQASIDHLFSLFAIYEVVFW